MFLMEFLGRFLLIFTMLNLYIFYFDNNVVPCQLASKKLADIELQ